MRIENIALGDNGKFFPLLYLLIVSLFVSSVILLWASVSGEFQFLERVGLLGASCFFGYYCAIGIQAIGISKRTVKLIDVENNLINCITFGELQVNCSKSSVSKVIGRELSGRGVRFLFPDNLQHYFFIYDKETFFISGAMNNIDLVLGEKMHLK